MYKGPCITPLMFEVLVRFRLRIFGIIADIEKRIYRFRYLIRIQIFFVSFGMKMFLIQIQISLFTNFVE